MSHAVLTLCPDQAAEVHAWEDALRPLLASSAGRMAAFQRIAGEFGVSTKNVVARFYAYQKEGVAALVNKRKVPALQQDSGRRLSPQDAELVRTYMERFKRKSAPALRALLRDYREGRVETSTPLNPVTGYPFGWSPRNLQRYAPTDYEIKAARIGRSAAAAHRPLVYTTRANLYVGQFLMWDDMWHDHEVVDLDQRRRGRPLEFHGLDLASACKVAWGNRTRVLRADGTHEGLKGGDFRFLLASFYATHGYHPDGTTNVIEHGTATVNESIERILHDATRGAIRFARGGMEGAAAHAGQYAGRSKGNFRFKAALESLGNLIHNEMAALPGQTGMDRRHAPEEQHGRQRHTDALLCALSQLPPERIEMLRWPLLTIAQFRLVAEEVYARINRRTEHALEGWDMRWLPDAATGRMRRMSPWEVWSPGRKRLRPLDDAALALLVGHEQGAERTTRNGMIELRDGEVSGDALRFDALALPDREKFLTVLNPFDASRLWCFDARGGFVSALPRLHSVCRADLDAVHREMGRAAKGEAERLQPLRLRHIAEAREKAAMHRHNADVLGGEPVTPEEKADARDNARRIALETGTLADFLDTPEPAAAPAESAGPGDDWSLSDLLPDAPED